MIDRNISFKKLETFLSFMSKENIKLVVEALNLSIVSVHQALHTLEEDVYCPLLIHKGEYYKPYPLLILWLSMPKKLLS